MRKGSSRSISGAPKGLRQTSVLPSDHCDGLRPLSNVVFLLPFKADRTLSALRSRTRGLLKAFQLRLGLWRRGRSPTPIASASHQSA